MGSEQTNLLKNLPTDLGIDDVAIGVQNAFILRQGFVSPQFFIVIFESLWFHLSTILLRIVRPLRWRFLPLACYIPTCDLIVCVD